ncbi:DUF3883 domain-containing protein [Rhizobium mongolense]|uniref:DUF3883 domain-containing protein n=1 Tax=Rhizobium mongolense TaxID=57676 RepID=UPI0034A1FC27
MGFDQLFTISAFEGLRLIRQLQAERPQASVDDCVELLRVRSAQASGLDLLAASTLAEIVPGFAPHDSVLFYRECVSAVMLQEMPAWAKLMTLGRGRFIKRLGAAEYRDIRSVFRESRLLDTPPSVEDVKWWDALTSRVRLNTSEVQVARSREAERLTLEKERLQLQNWGIDRVPSWIAIDDNTVGYDILSYRPAGNSVATHLIEVKSTVASPMRFILTRNEWDVADQVGDAYSFHIWDMTKAAPILHTRTVEQVRPHVPNDNANGKWKDVEIKL